MGTLFKGSEIFRVLSQRQFNSIIDHVRNGSICRCSLETESPVDFWFEIDSRSFG